MKSKVIHIIIYIMIVLVIFGIFTVYTYSTMMKDLKQYTILEKNSEVVIHEMNIIEVTDKIKIDVIENERKKVFIPITLFEERDNKNKAITDVIVYLDDELLLKEGYIYKDYDGSLYDFYSYSSNVVLYNVPLGIHNIRVEYMCYSEDIVKQYNDVTILELRNDTEDIE